MRIKTNRTHWDWSIVPSDITVTGNPVVVIHRLWLATPRPSRWQRVRSFIRGLFRGADREDVKHG